MTNKPEEPITVNLQLPVDTIDLLTTKVTYAMMACDDAPFGCASYLIVNTHELGVYRLRLTDDCLANLMDQFAKLIALADHLRGEETP